MPYSIYRIIKKPEITYQFIFAKLHICYMCPGNVFFSLEVPSSLGGGRMDGESTKRKSFILKTGVCPVWVTLVLSAKQR